jgi:hypothetical protein
VLVEVDGAQHTEGGYHDIDAEEQAAKDRVKEAAAALTAMMRFLRSGASCSSLASAIIDSA